MNMPTQPAMAPVDISMRREGAAVYLSSRRPLAPHHRTLGELFLDRSETGGDAVWLGDRRSPDEPWRSIGWGEGRSAAQRLATGLLEAGASSTRSVLVLSGNSLEHGLLTVACHLAGIPICPVSVPYSLLSQDHEKLKMIAAAVEPGLVFVDDLEAFGRAIASVQSTSPGVRVLAPDAEAPAIDFWDLATNSAELDESVTRDLEGDSVAKYLFTSGSTGRPKGVVNTHAMLTANQQAIAQVWPFLDEEPFVISDWLPWSHTFGGNHNFNMVLHRSGSLYVDRGKPTPDLVATTLANLRSVRPTVMFNVPAGFAALAQLLEDDPAAAEEVCERLRLIFYAAAALPDETWKRLEAITRRATGRPVAMTSSWGATETAPAATSAHFPLDRAGVIGVPLPGVELKLIDGPKTEVRVRGPNVTPGYLGLPASVTAEAFDEEGFYRIGDAVRLADPDDPNAGLVFDGRIAEDFKLSSGTWVSVTAVRIAVLDAAAGLIGDAVVAGHDRNEIGLLVWPGPGAGGQTPDISTEPTFLAAVRAAVETYNAAHPNSSARIARVAVLGSPPDLDADEITDKGYINQQAVLGNRSDVVESLFDDVEWPPTQLDLRRT